MYFIQYKRKKRLKAQAESRCADEDGEVSVDYGIQEQQNHNMASRQKLPKKNQQQQSKDKNISIDRMYRKSEMKVHITDPAFTRS